MSKHMPKSSFAYNLRHARISAGFSKEMTALVSCIPLSSIIKFETGSKSPSAQEVISLSKALGVPVETLMGEPVPQTDGVFFNAKIALEKVIGCKNPIPDQEEKE